MTWALRESNGQNKQVSCANLGKNQHDWRIGPAFGRAKAKQSPQQYAQIEPGAGRTPMSWVAANLPLIGDYLVAHLAQAAPAIAAALVLAIPMARLTQQVRWARGPLVTGASLLYAVPSLCLFVVLPIVLGTRIYDPVNVVVALTLYGLALLVPACVDALDSVDADAVDAAAAMGIGQVHHYSDRKSVV